MRRAISSQPEIVLDKIKKKELVKQKKIRRSLIDYAAGIVLFLIYRSDISCSGSNFK